MSDTPTTQMAARRIGAAAARWKSGEINAVAFADAVDRFADAVAELERENAALREHHQQDEALIVQRTDEIRHLETENAALRADKERYEWLKDGCGSAWAYKYLRNNFRINDDAIDAARKEKP